jgi:hypothetical protein
LLDRWNAERQAVYVDVFRTFTLVPALNPHTIGPTGATFTVSQRPVTIESIMLILETGVRIHVVQQDVQAFAADTVPTLESTFPTKFYYGPSWPNGAIHFWPIPTVAYGVDIQSRIVLAEPGLDDEISLPPGYRDALTLTLAEDVASGYGVQIPPKVAQGARMARAQVWKNNDQPRRITTTDAGMPGSNAREGFNYRSGGWQ